MAVSNDLCTDRRVDRHCRALTEAGFEVVLVGRELPKSLPVERPYPTRRLRLKHQRGWQFYAELNRRLASELAALRPDIVWSNDTDTLLGCRLAALRRRCPLVMDAHEFFPEVPELVHKPLVKWVWRSIERLLMPRCDALLTVCDSIAEHYRHGLGVSMSVVRNLPEGESLKVKEERSGAKVLLYQGCVNLGRGVDWAIDALEWLPQCRLVVAGDGDLLESMKAYAAAKPWSDRISFTGRLMPDELQALTPQADVGLVMLEDLGLNYRYALPNRIGDFVQAGVPMVVSDLPEMSAVVKRYGVGEIIERLHGADGQANAQALARAVEKVLARQWTDADFAAARRDMDWNKEKETLINIANKLCSTTSY